MSQPCIGLPGAVGIAAGRSVHRLHHARQLEDVADFIMRLVTAGWNPVTAVPFVEYSQGYIRAATRLELVDKGEGRVFGDVAAGPERFLQHDFDGSLTGRLR